MNTYEKARAFMYRCSRPLELALWQYHFEQGRPEIVAEALLAYQNEDGTFAHGVNSGANNDELLSRTCGYTYQAAYDARLIAQMFNNGIDYFSAWSYLSNGLLEGNPTVSYHVAKNAAKMAGAIYHESLCDDLAELGHAVTFIDKTKDIISQNMLQKEVEGMTVVLMAEVAELVQKDVVLEHARQAHDAEIQVDIAFGRATSPVGSVMFYGNTVICETVSGRQHRKTPRKFCLCLSSQ